MTAGRLLATLDRPAPPVLVVPHAGLDRSLCATDTHTGTPAHPATPRHRSGIHISMHGKWIEVRCGPTAYLEPGVTVVLLAVQRDGGCAHDLSVHLQCLVLLRLEQVARVRSDTVTVRATRIR